MQTGYVVVAIVWYVVGASMMASGNPAGVVFFSLGTVWLVLASDDDDKKKGKKK